MIRTRRQNTAAAQAQPPPAQAQPPPPPAQAQPPPPPAQAEPSTQIQPPTASAPSTQPRRRTHRRDSGETIDIDNISGSSDGSERDAVPPAQTRRRNRTPANAAPTPRAASSSTSSVAATAATSTAAPKGAQDIHHFFDKKKGTKTICHLCRYVSMFTFNNGVEYSRQLPYQRTIIDRAHG